MENKNLPKGTEDLKLQKIRSRERRHLILHLASGPLIRKKSRLLIALVSVVIGASVISSISNVYLDIISKMGRELRSYGANMIILPESRNMSDTFDESKLNDSLKKIPRDKLIGSTSYLYNFADVISGSKVERIVVAGTNFKGSKKVNPYWKIKGALPKEKGEILVGTEVAEKLKLKRGDVLSIKQVAGKLETKKNSVPQCANCHADPVEIHKNRSMNWADINKCTTCHQPHLLDIFDSSLPRFKITGIISTGGAEDNQVFISLNTAQEIFKQPKKISAAYLSVAGQLDDIKNYVKKIKTVDRSLFPQPIKRISQSEGKILFKIQNLIYPIVAMIVLSTILGVMITMIAMTLERKREIGLKKAIGAEDKDIALEFLGEAVILGLFGGLLGWILGFIFAQWIGQTIFNSMISVRVITIPLTLGTSLLITGLASFAPVKMATKVNPAIVLKED